MDYSPSRKPPSSAAHARGRESSRPAARADSTRPLASLPSAGHALAHRSAEDRVANKRNRNREALEQITHPSGLCPRVLSARRRYSPKSNCCPAATATPRQMLELRTQHLRARRKASSAAMWSGWRCVRNTCSTARPALPISISEAAPDAPVSKAIEPLIHTKTKEIAVDGHLCISGHGKGRVK